jgi:hypothetical protein
MTKFAFLERVGITDKSDRLFTEKEVAEAAAKTKHKIQLAQTAFASTT